MKIFKLFIASALGTLAICGIAEAGRIPPGSFSCTQPLQSNEWCITIKNSDGVGNEAHATVDGRVADFTYPTRTLSLKNEAGALVNIRRSYTSYPKDDTTEIYHGYAGQPPTLCGTQAGLRPEGPGVNWVVPQGSGYKTIILPAVAKPEYRSTEPQASRTERKVVWAINDALKERGKEYILQSSSALMVVADRIATFLQNTWGSAEALPGATPPCYFYQEIAPVNLLMLDAGFAYSDAYGGGQMFYQLYKQRSSAIQSEESLLRRVRSVTQFSVGNTMAYSEVGEFGILLFGYCRLFDRSWMTWSNKYIEEYWRENGATEEEIAAKLELKRRAYSECSLTGDYGLAPEKASNSIKLYLQRKPQKRSKQRFARFSVHSDNAESLLCKIDKRKLRPCQSGRAYYRRLAIGKHRFLVVASNSEGEKRRVYRWRVVR